MEIVQSLKQITAQIQIMHRKVFFVFHGLFNNYTVIWNFVTEKNNITNAIKKVKYSSFFTLLIPLDNKSNDLLNRPSFKILETLKSLKTLIKRPSRAKAD